MSATVHSPCDEAYYYQTGHRFDQCRGVTTWNLENEFTVSPILTQQSSSAVTFTCTTPKCYSYWNSVPNSPCPPQFSLHGQDACNVVFNAWRTGSGTSPTSIQLQYFLNGTIVGSSYLSEVSTHGATQAYELGNVNRDNCSLIYDDMGRNTLVFFNNSNSTIQLDHVKIYRTYKMCQPPVDYSGSCTFDYAPCYKGTDTGTIGGFDATRIDTPCFCGGGGLSATHWQDTIHSGSTIAPGQKLSWTFNFGALPDNPHRNYVDKSICLFNFNNVQATSTVNGDVALQATLNGSLINTYYLSGKMHALAPSHNLAVEDNYHDTLPNTVELVNTSTVDVVMGGGASSGVDVFRIYESSPVTCCGECQTSCQTCYTSCYGCQPCMICAGCYYCQTCQEPCQPCEFCQPCETCQPCVSCQPCVTCQPCETCVGCYTCQPCVGCQVECQVGCYDCMSCYFCFTSCFDCEACYSNYSCCQICQDCQMPCLPCETCQPCQICQPCEGCQSCQECQPCVSCQPCVACQPCEGCQVGCAAGCYDCQTCYFCFTSCFDCEACYSNY